ncbi:MAG: phosphatase PAP2 family protein [Bacteroidales bacterium]|jgi:membrane-associated phospholipid phosphatase|nr:phosphatase PAP2 family protein [Bacteroidales bacterium]
MFSTALNHFLQSINNEVLHTISELMKILNQDLFFFVIFFAFIFGIDFKRGFLMIHAFFWTIVINQLLKSWINLPRPVDIDANLRILGENINQIKAPSKPSNTPVNLNAESIEYARNNYLISGGFPSAIMAKASIFWLSIWHFYKQNWLLLSAAVILVFSAITALYFGENFGIDIIAGVVLGILIYLFVFQFLYKAPRLSEFSQKPMHGFIHPWKAFGRIIYFFVIPSLLLLIPQIELNIIAKFIGLNLAYYLIGIKRWPKNDGTTFQRMLRVLLAIFVFGMINLITAQFTVVDYSIKYFMTNLFEMYLSIHFSVWLCRRSGLYKK